MQAVAFTWAYSILMYSIAAAGDCKPCDPQAPNSCNPGIANAFSNLNCKPDHYNPVATLVSSPNGAPTCPAPPRRGCGRCCGCIL